ncbi:MAG: proline racemase family protein, partial [Anaerolineae bacterium]|nr:proline racemase family protein [Anaerolineae bacterium]
MTNATTEWSPKWATPKHWTKITTIDAHTEGEPFRVITGGFPELPGSTILERRRYAKEHLEHLRTALMFEPRGHADMYGCIITPPVSPEADFGILFMHNEGYSTMCGHGIIAISKVAVETGLVTQREPETTVRIDSPAGLVTAHASIAAATKAARTKNRARAVRRSCGGENERSSRTLRIPIGPPVNTEIC